MNIPEALLILVGFIIVIVLLATAFPFVGSLDVPACGPQPGTPECPRPVPLPQFLFLPRF